MQYDWSIYVIFLTAVHTQAIYILKHLLTIGNAINTHEHKLTHMPLTHKNKGCSTINI